MVHKAGAHHVTGETSSPPEAASWFSLAPHASFCDHLLHTQHTGFLVSVSRIAQPAPWSCALAWTSAAPSSPPPPSPCSSPGHSSGTRLLSSSYILREACHLVTITSSYRTEAGPSLTWLEWFSAVFFGARGSVWLWSAFDQLMMNGTDCQVSLLAMVSLFRMICCDSVGCLPLLGLIQAVSHLRSLEETSA